MKVAAAVMLALLVGLGALCLHRGGVPLFQEGLRASGRTGLQLAPLLAVVILLCGFVEVLLPRDMVAAWLSDSAGARGIFVAWVAGALTPGGGPVGLPLAAALHRAGAGMGVLVTYVTSMSLLSFVRIPLELGTYGTRLTVLRVAGCALLPPVAGLIASAIERAMK